MRYGLKEWGLVLMTAETRSKDDGCTLHVNAILGRRGRHGEHPIVVGFRLSDWCDSATVATFIHGERQ